MLKRALIIFETTEIQGNDWMVGDLRRGLQVDGFEVSHLHGCFQCIPHGGLKLKRLANALFMLLLLPFVLFFRKRFDLVIVRSTPPLLHLPTALICKILRIPCVFWLMDYHPEIEKRIWAGRVVLGQLIGLLDVWDRWALKTFASVVVLDDAMDACVQSRVEGLSTIVHPTWGQSSSEAVSRGAEPVGVERQGICLAYVGNFGRGHVWDLMVQVIQSLAANQPVHILTIGIPEDVIADFQGLTRFSNVTLAVHPRLPFVEVVTLLQHEHVDYGCVAMRNELAGCLSPSKFASYIEAEIPILYIGPEKTNTWKVCVDFDAGVWLPETPSAEQYDKAITTLISNRSQLQAQSATLQAKTYFRSFNGETLSHKITTSLN